MNYIALNIRHLRKLKNAKQGEIAALLGHGSNTVSNYERGISNPSQRELLIIADFFGVTVEILTKEDLTSKWSTWQDVEDWRERMEDVKRRQTLHLQGVSQSPLWITALKKHYIKTISEITGRPSQEVEKEIGDLFREELAKIQKVTT